jgi:N-acetyl-anhydromuramoyl-L-alanine amidase
VQKNNTLQIPLPSAIQSGWLDVVRHCPSPNFNRRPTGEQINLLVIHNISLPPGEFGGGYVEQFFCNTLPIQDHAYFASISQLQVSAHCFIDRQGAITQFVSFEDRAWHAGASEFQGRNNCNDFSVGIELEGTDLSAYTEVQYRSLVCISQLLMQEYSALNKQRIVGHSDIAPGRKTDPGSSFDWTYFFAQLLTWHRNTSS